MNWRAAPFVLVLVLLAALPLGWADPSFGLGAVAPIPAPLGPLRQAGIRAVKIIADWSAIEPAPGRLLWADLDAAVAGARREKLEPVIVLTYTPKWASLASGEDARDPAVALRSPPRQSADWERFVAAAVRRYRDAVKQWQIWTVPALPQFRGTATEYLALLRAARRASRTVDPSSRIVAASPQGFDLIHVQRAVTQAPDAVSVVSLAPAGLAPEQWLRPLAVLRQRVLPGDRPLWVEWGPERSEGAGGAVVRAVAVARAAGAERLFITGDLRRLDEPARAALSVLDALPFTGYLVRDPGVYALLFGSGERATLVVWRTEVNAVALDVQVLPTARVVALDQTPVAPIQEGRVALTAGPGPVFVSGVVPALVEEARATLQQRGPLLPVLPRERDFSGAPEVAIRLGREIVERGLHSVLRTRRNGAVEPVEVNGEDAVRPVAGSREQAFLYFDVDDTFLFFNDGRFDVLVTVEVLGVRAAQGVGFNLFYDARSGYRFTPWQWVEAREGWVSHTFRLEDASFANTAGWDFAINAGANRREDLIVRALTVRKVAR